MAMHKQFGSCYETHPILPLGLFMTVHETEVPVVIHGGSCIRPVCLDADVYIGFDHSMTFTGKGYPWEDGYEIFFDITDQQAPNNAGDFHKLVDWTGGQLKAGKKVHAGCIGGHGRTGLFFAALVAIMLPEEKDAVGYVREHYCKKAVESSVQMDFLVKNFGIKKVPISDFHSSLSTGTHAASNVIEAHKANANIEPSDTGRALYGPGNIWGME